MAGSLLVSGNPQHYKAIGEGGQPVYSVAFQLREAIRLKAGATTANCLAIPQSNQHGSMVDWYAPVAGDVVPWSAMSSGEREYALSKLDVAHRTLERAIAQMEQAQSRDDQAEREKNTVLPLLNKVFYFPDTNFIFLVNGEPVIAFWGFHSEGAALPADPFMRLRVPASPTDSVAPATQTKRAWWWWLLLLLLLLILLFFLLRACAPQVLPVEIRPTTLVTPENRSVTPVTPVSPAAPVAPDVPLLPGAPDSPNATVTPESFVEQGRALIQRWWPGSGVIATPGGPDAVSGNTGDVTPEAGGGHSTEVPAGNPPETPAVTPLESPSGTTANPPAERSSGTANQTPAQTPEQVPGQNPAAVGTPPNNPTGSPSTQQGAPMTIPQQAINSGNTSFLDGSWSAGTGIQDAKTGKPLRMEYDFSQGNGQGKVTIRRADGSQCVGAVSAQMQSKNLQISDRGVAKCSDGGTIALPKVTCTPQADGRADCQGRYENGTTFPVSMRHSPK